MFPKEAAPVNGVPRGVVTMGAGAHRNQPLGVFWFLFHVEKELAPQGETLGRYLRRAEVVAPYTGSPLSGRVGIPAPTGIPGGRWTM